MGAGNSKEGKWKTVFCLFIKEISSKAENCALFTRDSAARAVEQILQNNLYKTHVRKLPKWDQTTRGQDTTNEEISKETCGWSTEAYPSQRSKLIYDIWLWPNVQRKCNEIPLVESLPCRYLNFNNIKIILLQPFFLCSLVSNRLKEHNALDAYSWTREKFPDIVSLSYQKQTKRSADFET